MGRRMGSGGTPVVRALPSVTDLYEVEGHVLLREEMTRPATSTSLRRRVPGGGGAQVNLRRYLARAGCPA